MPRVVHFEIPASDVARAVEFYRTVFGWEISTWGGPMEYFLADTGKEGPGINGAIMGNGGTAKTTVNTIGVAALDESVEKIIAAGGARVTSATSATARTPKAICSGSWNRFPETCSPGSLGGRVASVRRPPRS
jgi:predicted enzyme related to lactoylglutathione lyase